MTNCTNFGSSKVLDKTFELSEYQALVNLQLAYKIGLHNNIYDDLQQKIIEKSFDKLLTIVK